MAAREQVGIDVVAHDMASDALHQVGGSLRDVGKASADTSYSLKGVQQDLTAGRDKSLMMADATATLHSKLAGLTSSSGFQSMILGVGMGAGMMAWNAVQNAMTGVVGALQGAVQSAIEAEQSQTRLVGAIEANVKGWDGSTAAIQRVIAARFALGFTDEEQKNALTLLVTKTGDVSKALDIERVAMDLARLKGIDLAQASKAIVMGMEGQGRALIELGIKVGDFTNTSEVLAAVQAKAAGQAEDFSNTTAGALAAMNVQIDEASTVIGNELLPLVRDLAKGFADFVQGAAPVAVQVIRDLGSFAASTGREVDQLTGAWQGFVDVITTGKTGPSPAATPQGPSTSGWDQALGPHLGPALSDFFFPRTDAEAAAKDAAEAAAAAYPASLARAMAAQASKMAAISRGAGFANGADIAIALQASFEAHMQAGQTGIANAVKKHASDVISAELTAGAKRANGIASTWSKGLGAQLGAGEPEWIMALNALGKDMQSSLTKSANAGYILAALNSKMIQQGLASGKPGIAAETAALVSTMLVTLDKSYGPAFLAAYNFGSGIVNAAARAMAAGQMKAFGNASPGMAPIVPKYVAPVIPSMSGNADYQALMAAAQGIKAVGAAAGGTSTALADAKTKLNALASDAKTNLSSAFDKAKTSAHAFFDDLHSKNLQAISDTRDLANAQLDAQIGAANAPVDAARAALQATQDARQLASLQAAMGPDPSAALQAVQDARQLASLQAGVGSAADPAAQQAAETALSDFQAAQAVKALEAAARQQSAAAALSDFQAEQAIKALEATAKTQVNALTLQQKANDDAAALAVKAEDARATAQSASFDKQLAALQTYLDKHPAMWAKESAAVIKLLNDDGVTYAASGAALGKAFADGLLAQEKAVTAAAKALAKAAADVLKIKSPAALGPLAEDQSVWGENLGRAWTAGLQRGLASYSQLPALADIRLTLQGGGTAPIAPQLGRAVGPAAVGGSGGGASTVYLNVTVAGGIVDPSGAIGQQIADSLILPLRRALDRNGTGLAAR